MVYYKNAHFIIYVSVPTPVVCCQQKFNLVPVPELAQKLLYGLQIWLFYVPPFHRHGVVAKRAGRNGERNRPGWKYVVLPSFRWKKKKIRNIIKVIPGFFIVFITTRVLRAARKRSPFHHSPPPRKTDRTTACVIFAVCRAQSFSTPSTKSDRASGLFSFYFIASSCHLRRDPVGRRRVIRAYFILKNAQRMHSCDTAFCGKRKGKTKRILSLLPCKRSRNEIQSRPKCNIVTLPIAIKTQTNSNKLKQISRLG